MKISAPANNDSTKNFVKNSKLPKSTPDKISATPVGQGFLTVGIGASAGGIKALKEFFAAMPPDSGMAFVVILHLSEEHESSLAKILQSSTSMNVVQVTETVKVEPNHVYVIPPAKHLAMSDGHITRTEPERIKGRRVPIDLFFRTLADAYGKNAIAVVLSGTGSDGTLGLKRVKESGGISIAQEPAEAEYDGMPRSAINTGLVDLVLPVGEIPAKLIELRDNAERINLPKEKDTISPNKQGREPDELNEILKIVRIATGHDFSAYKQATVLRRIARRLQVHGLQEMPEYLAFLREHAEEAEALQRDLLITVTNFFRDKEAFETLEKDFVPQLFEGKSADDTVRVWSIGCATGEEAYSLAIILDEYASGITNAPKIQIFASDINERAIAAARECFYEQPIVADVSPERLRRYFKSENGGWRVRDELRETILFAPHNILRDPPFSRLDLIVCRNLLIYFNRETQNKVFGIFNFALRQNGFLFLGGSESAENATALFSVKDKKHRIYKARLVSHHKLLPDLPTPEGWNTKKLLAETGSADKPPTLSYGDLHYKLVEQFAPPSVLVNEEFEIAHISENSDRYLRVVAGEPTRDLLKSVNPALKLDLQTALHEAKKSGFVGESRNVRFKTATTETLLNITVRLVQSDEAAAGFYLVIFDESKTAFAASGEKKFAAPSMATAEREQIEAVLRQMERELQISRERLRTTIEQNETSSEELKASNEELQAINEEQRSTSEELETSKEELQSLNEELTTLNAELKDKVDETARLNADLQNLIHSTDIGTIFLDRALQIKSYTSRVADLFNIIPSDIGRPFEHLTHRLENNELADDAGEVLRTLHLKERETRGGTSDNRYLVRIAPYRTLDDRIDGVVLSFQNITALARASDALTASEAKYRALFNSIDEGFCVIEMLADENGEFSDWRYLETNPMFEKYAFKNAVGKTISEIAPNVEPKWFDIYGSVARTGEPVRLEDYTAVTNSWFSLYVFRFGEPVKNVVAVVFQDITERKLNEEALRESEERLRLAAEAAEMYSWEFSITDQTYKFSQNAPKILGINFEDLPKTVEDTYRLIYPDDRELIQKTLERALQNGDAFSVDFRSVKRDGEIVWLSVQTTVIKNAEGRSERIIGIAQNVTERKRAEENLHEYEQRLRLAVEAGELGTWEWHLLTDQVLWNERHFILFGMQARPNPLPAKEFFNHIHPLDAERVREQLEQAVRHKTIFQTEFRAVTDAGDVRWMGGYGQTVETDANGETIRMSGVMFDVSEIKHAEEVQRQKETLQTIIGAQEDERRRIAQDLHDQLGQQLTALRLKIESVKNLCDGDAVLCERVDETQAIAAQIDADIDFLAWEMRPSTLDDIGLAAALANYVSEWATQFGLSADFQAGRFGKNRLPPEAETHLYRIAQEALNNISKHAQAKNVDVALEHRGDFTVLIIEDDGVGFAETKPAETNSKQIGLVGMRERAALIGGTIEIESAPGEGTTIFVRIPALSPAQNIEKSDNE